jgi:flagellar hook assembly protein FlgD
VMGYDYRTAGSSPVGSIAPLARTGYDIRDTIIAYTARVSPSKLILGVPYYGRAWSTSSSAIHASNTSGTKYGASASVNYAGAMDYLAKYGRKYDTTEQVAWTAYERENCTSTYGCVTSWRQLYVDDATAVSAKYDLVNRYNLRGAGIWALGYDGTRTELWAAIQKKFIGDTGPPTAGVKTLSSRQANPRFTVSWVGKDDVAVKSYDVQYAIDGGAWATWLSATTSTSRVWSGADNHVYAFRARGRDARGNVGTWNVTTTSASAGSLDVDGFGLVRVDELSKRSAAGTTATNVGTFSAGQLVWIVGGPTVADGYTWYQVRGPITEWRPITSPGVAVWVAVGGGGQTWLSSTKAPNATAVRAAIGDIGYSGAGAASLGTSAAAVASRSFSPNGDGSRDRLAIAWTNDRTFDALSLKVFTSAGALVGTVPVPQLAAGARQWSWDGRVAGKALANGRYLATFVGSAGGSTFYNPSTGFTTTAFATHGITIDTVAPVVSSAGISGTILSPNGDGILDTVKASMAATGATGWSFRAAPMTGTTIGSPVDTRSGTGGSAAVTWGGTADNGSVVADGSYRVTLSVHDGAGNTVTRSWTVRVDATPAIVNATASPSLFSPNGDGAADTVRLSWSSNEAISGAARILRGTTVVRSWAITKLAGGAITWNGTTATGTAAPDSAYTFRVSGRDAAGNLTTRTSGLVLDRTLSTVRWSRPAFYPQDGDGIMASARMTFSLKRSAVVTVGIYSGATLVRTVWSGRSLVAGSYGWTWNGRNVAGAFVARGTYQVRVTATSSLGTAVIGRTVLVDAFRVAASSKTLTAGQTLTLTLTTTESLRAAPAVAFTQTGRSAVTRTATSLGSGRYRVSFTIASGGVGPATYRISGRDTAGGLNVSTGTITVR